MICIQSSKRQSFATDATLYSQSLYTVLRHQQRHLLRHFSTFFACKFFVVQVHRDLFLACPAVSMNVNTPRFCRIQFKLSACICKFAEVNKPVLQALKEIKAKPSSGFFCRLMLARLYIYAPAAKQVESRVERDPLSFLQEHSLIYIYLLSLCVLKYVCVREDTVCMCVWARYTTVL